MEKKRNNLKDKDGNIIIPNILIDKDEQPSGTNTYDKETIDTLINNLSGQILWRNSDPSSDFKSQTINLLDKNYDTILIYFKHFKSDNDCFGQFFLKGLGSELIKVDKDSAIQTRTIKYVSDTQLKFGDGIFWHPTLGSEVQNSRCIPLYIIGFKTGLF